LKLLLDTHIWIWSLFAPDRLTGTVTGHLESPANELWLSPISVWETLLLVERGRLKVRGQPAAVVNDMLKTGPFREAPVTHAVAMHSRRVQLPHEDPADRFLAATAVVYDLTLVTADDRMLNASGLSVLANR
jgi:PIN domain nuclease of toxin-antitoxin system